MASVPCTALESLPKVAVDRAILGNALLHLLAREGTRVELAAKAAVGAYVFAVNSDCAFALSTAPADPTALDQLCDALDGADALLSHVERQLGIALDPQGYGPLEHSAFAQPDAFFVNLYESDSAVHLALVAGDVEAEIWRNRAAAISYPARSVPVPVTLQCQAARLPIAVAAGLAAGDLLLLPRFILSTLVSSATPEVTGRFDAHSGEWRAGEFGDFEDDTMTDIDPPATTGFAVPITLRLPQQAVDAAQLAAMAPGMVLPLSPLSHGLAVELLVGGKRVARGEIVEMGENFAVHIDECFAAVASPQTGMGAD